MKKFLIIPTGVTLALLVLAQSEEKTHQVEKGDNLWNISKTYLENPFRWQDIWEWNPQIKNPHLIYPGNQVKLKPGTESSENPFADSPKENKQALSFAEKIRGLEKEQNKNKLNRKADEQNSPSRGILKDNILLQAPFLEELNFASSRVYEPLSKWIAEPTLHLNESYRLLKSIEENDVYEIFKVGPKVKSVLDNSIIGEVLSVSGVLKYNTQVEEKGLSILTHQYQPITGKEWVRKFITREARVVKEYTEYLETSPRAQIIYSSADSRSVLPYSFVIIETGLEHPFRQSDGVSFFNRNVLTGGVSDKFLGRGIVVLSQKRSVTVLVTEVQPGILNVGDYAKITHKAVYEN